MANNYSTRLGATVFILMFTCISIFSEAQISYRYLGTSGTALVDINDSGHAVLSGATYDYASAIITAMDTDVVQLNGINNNGDLIGMMNIDIMGTPLYQPAYKHNGTWFPIGFFPNAGIEAAATVYQISENGNYVTGQMSPDCCDFQAFLYNVTTDSLERIADPVNEYSAGYCVNDAGIVGGWFDPPPVGTLRVPALMTTGSVVTSLPPGVLPSTGGETNAISNNNVVVGYYDNIPFIYDSTTSTFTTFAVPVPYESGTFTSVSENGIAVGYYQRLDLGDVIRDAIIYHPLLGAQPVLIKDVLATHGLTIPTADGLLGTAIAISPDGNYVCGWENGPFFFASGWAINFNDSLLTTFVKEINADEWNVYPNPSKDFVNISGKEKIKSLKVFNALLQEKINIEVDAKSVAVNLALLAPGIYFVEVMTARGRSVIKVARQ